MGRTMILIIILQNFGRNTKHRKGGPLKRGIDFCLLSFGSGASMTRPKDAMSVIAAGTLKGRMAWGEAPFSNPTPNVRPVPLGEGWESVVVVLCTTCTCLGMA